MITDLTWRSSLYINGQLRAAEGDREYTNLGPATGAPVGTAADATAADVDEAIGAARAAFDAEQWSTDRTLRVTSLRRLRSALAELADEWRPHIAAETGAPLGLTYGYQLDLPIRFMDWTIGLAERYDFERDLGVTQAMQMPTRRLVV